MPSEVEKIRRSLSQSIDPKKKSLLGQFFTPGSIAHFMARLFVQKGKKNCRLLDAGAGMGCLSVAFLERWTVGDFDFKTIELHAFEIDTSLHPYLNQVLQKYKDQTGFSLMIRDDDFIHTASDFLAGSLFNEPLPVYTHAILNPPYKKMRSNSSHRASLRNVSIETVNLYSAFVALALALLEEQGQLVAIIPRSFCNGLYYKPFRNFILKRSALRHIHLFKSRSKAFKDDDVLQENIIIRLERNGVQGPVVISTSTDDSFSDLALQEYPFDRIVFPEDTEQFIHVPMSFEINALEVCSSIKYSLSDLKINVSTGPVVDFRLKEHLHEMPGKNTVPLLYPTHFKNNIIEWPKQGIKKPNAINRNHETEKWLYPNGFYCVVRRFSSKEEKRRVVANVVDPLKFSDTPLLGFENHLNVFHANKQGLPKELSFGLSVFLNTTAVDEHFRTFNGHTQVNATDLKRLKYPSRDTLSMLGRWVLDQTEITQEMIDNQLEILFNE